MIQTFIDNHQVALLTTIGLLFSYIFLILVLAIKYSRFNGLGDIFLLLLSSVSLIGLAGYVVGIW